MMEFQDRAQATVQRLYERANRWSGGVLGILGDAVNQFGEAQASRAAAGLAYYLFFALFPLLLLLMAAATYIWNLDSDVAFQQAVGFIAGIIPVSRALIASTLEGVVDRRGAFTLLGIVGLAWSASSAFAILSNNINQAWPSTESRGFVKQRLVALVMVIAMIVLLLLSLVLSAAQDLILDIVVLGASLGPVLRILISELMALMLTMAVFIGLYRWIPTAEVSWRASLWGAGTAAIIWQAAQVLFTRYLASELVQYELVYGALASVVSLLFWIYVSASILLLSAHLTAAIDRKHREAG